MITVFAISPLFQAMGHITCLRSISVGISQFDSLDSMAYFIRAHSETLQTIVIYLVDVCLSPDKIFAHTGEKLFPNLSVLAIRECEQGFLLQDHDSRSATTTFIHRCSSSLASLSLMHSSYSRDSIFHLLNPAADTPISFSAMTFLHITLCLFTAELMDLFVDCLPNLHELDLVIYKLLDEDTMLLRHQQDDEVSFIPWTSSRSFV